MNSGLGRHPLSYDVKKSWCCTKECHSCLQDETVNYWSLCTCFKTFHRVVKNEIKNAFSPAPPDTSQRQCWTFTTVSLPPSQTHHFWTILELASATARIVEIQALLQLDSTMYLIISHPQTCEYQAVTSPTTVQQHVLCFVHQIKQLLPRYLVEGEEH